MTGWRPLAFGLAVALAAAAGAVAGGFLGGMGRPEVAHLALLLLPAAAASIVAAALAARLLRRAPFRQRLASIALVAVAVSLANLIVLARLMFVSRHDLAVVALLLVYSAGAGAAVALVLARAPRHAVARLSRTAGALAAGDLSARAGRLDAGIEIDALGRTLDEMAERLERSIAAEQSGERKRRDLITAVSHDLRTPLSGLRAMIEAIDDGVVGDPPTLRRYVIEMRRQVDSLVALVDDLFELVQLDAGAIEAESERARLEDVIHSAVKACEVQAREKGLVLEQRLDGAGSAPCSPRLIRVLQNLLQNAIRHTPADGTVRIEAHRRPEGLELIVEDTGEGIDADAAERVFEPFWRGDAARSGQGSGLGLAVAKRIVEALGGEIRVESAAPAGARFAVLLPDAR